MIITAFLILIEPLTPNCLKKKKIAFASLRTVKVLMQPVSKTCYKASNFLERRNTSNVRYSVTLRWYFYDCYIFGG